MRVKIANKNMFNNALSSLFPQLILSEVNGFTIDSRLVESGDIYLPIKGENVDGHDFISKAISNGASLIISDQSSAEAVAEVIYVDSTLNTLKRLSMAYMEQLECPIIGITGSNGKTTVKELLNHVLSSHKKTMCSTGNYNSSIGLPISIFTFNGDEDFCILEMGASKPKEIAELCKIAKPTMGLITNIAAAHTESFGSMDNVAKTKSDLFTSLPNDGTAFINVDDDYITTFTTNANQITYGFDSEADFHGKYENGTLTVNDFQISLLFPSEMMAKNVLAIFSIASSIGIPPYKIGLSVNTFRTPTGRNDVVVHNGITIINDTYNANLHSAKAGIDILSNYDGNRKIAIIGDMFELGELAQDHHRELGEYISNSNIDILLATGELTQFTVDSACKIDATFYQNKGELINALSKIAKPEDIIYVKGSRGMEMETIIEKGLLN